MMYSTETLVRESVKMMNLVLSDKFKEHFLFFFFLFGKGESTKQIAMYSRTQEK